MAKKLFTVVVVIIGLAMQFSCVEKNQRESATSNIVSTSSEPVVETMDPRIFQGTATSTTSAEVPSSTLTPTQSEPVVELSVPNENIPDTPEAKKIMKTVEKAREIEREALYTGDFSKFPTVFINDPRFNLDQYTLQTVRELTGNLSLESAGWLDYKTAMYSWGRNARMHSEAVHATAQAENRPLTDEEKASLIDPYGRVAPGPPPPRDELEKIHLKFKSVIINSDIATVIAVLDTGFTMELTLVLVEDHWYIAAFKSLSVP